MALTSLQQLDIFFALERFRDDEAARVGQSTSDVEYASRTIALANLQDLIDAFNGEISRGHHSLTPNSAQPAWISQNSSGGLW